MVSMLKARSVVAADRVSALQESAVYALPALGHMSLVSTLQDLATLEPQWKNLEKSAKIKPSVFQSFDWISSWSKTYITGKTELCIVTGYVNDKLVFALPLMKDRRGPITVLRWLSEPFCQYGDALIAADQNPRTWLGNAVELIHKLKNIDIIRLRHVRADASMHDFCQTDMKDARLKEKAPFLGLTPYANESSYDARYTSTQRKRRKKIRKELEKHGSIDFRILPNGTIGDVAMAEAILEKNKWLGERGRQNRILKCPGHLKFLKELSRAKNTDVEMVISELQAGGKAVSWEIGFNFHGTHFAYITSHVNALTDLSPGRLHMDLSQRTCIKQGLQTFDLMVPYDPHKESWSSGFMATSDYYLPLTLSGQIFGRVYLRTLRPLIRRVYYKTPPWVLKIVKPLFGI
jgi:CelD/BcsL family acetyltransferase involved in cellulose biosynthesis